MKILQVCIHYPPMWGGIETFASSLVEYMDGKGHETEVLCAHGAMHLPDVGEYNGTRVHRIPVGHGILRKNPRFLLQSIRRCREVVKDFAPDVVHLHGGGAILMSYVTSPELKALPMVLTMHDFPADGGERNPSVVDIFKRAGVIVTDSKIRFDDARAYVSETADKVRCIYVSKPPLPDALPAERSRTPLILMTGRQTYKKGFDLAVEAFARVVLRFPDASLVLVGDGEEHEALKGQVADLGLGGVVAFPGRVSLEEMSQWYRRAWMSLVPSRHSESFGLVSVEAMQNGCVVLGSRAGGIPEVVEDGVTGLIFEKGSVEGMVAGICSLLEDPERFSVMGEAGRERAATVFSWEDCAQEYEAIYHRLLG